MSAYEDDVNDALYAMMNGKQPDAPMIKGVQKYCLANDNTDVTMAVNTLLRVIGGYGADAGQVTVVKAMATAAEIDDTIVNIVDAYADPDSESPKNFDRSQMANIALELLGVKKEDLSDPSSRVGDVVVDAGEDEVPPGCGDSIISFLDSAPWQILIGFCTAWALFATDVALWTLSKDADMPIGVITLFVFIFFLFEFMSNIILGRDYGSDVTDLFFILDFVGTLSLVPDFLIVFDIILESPENVVLARVARAARIGARLSRLTKVFRVKNGESAFTSMMSDRGMEVEQGDEAAAEVSSQVGDKVADGISKKVVILVIVLLVCIPIFEFQEPRGGVKQTKEEAMHMLYSMKGASAWKSQSIATCNRTSDSIPPQTPIARASYATLGDADSTLAADWCTSCSTCSGTTMTDSEVEIMREFLTLSGDSTVYFTWDRDQGTRFADKKSATFGATTGDATFFLDTETILGLREQELRKYGDTVDEYVLEPGEHKSLEVRHRYGGMEMWVNMKDKTSSEAVLNIAFMWFVIVIFAISSLVFMSDLETLVIEPVEGMTKAMSMIMNSLIDLGGSTEKGNEASYIENSVLKIVSLLNVSFGDAGRHVMDRAMSGNSEPGSEPGYKVQGVYGMSDIREFTSVTEALNQDIVLFVNEFGNICHSSCQENNGAPNKNVGDAFLCVWVEGRGKDGANLADSALAAYRQSVQKIRNSGNLDTLIARKEMAARFPAADQEFGKYLPCMGFGLHYGSSIEGLIGTSLKRDAAYLGADVDLSDRLEEVTKEYKTPILMSEAFYNRLSPEVQTTCRLVDRVKYSGIDEPFKLYAANVASTEGNYFDRDLEEDVFAEVDAEAAGKGSLLKTGKQTAAEKMEADAENDEAEEAVEEVVDEDDGVSRPMGLGQLKALEDDWNADFETAVEDYIKGDFSSAARTLANCLADRSWDGPAQKLAGYIKSCGGKAPSGWDGYVEI